MTKSDLELLIEMGFEQARAELAVKKTGGCQCFSLTPSSEYPHTDTACSAASPELARGEPGHASG